MKYLIAKIALGLMIVGLIAWAALAVTTELPYQLIQLSSIPLAGVLAGNLVLSSLLFALWAFVRDGALKGMLWTVLFLVTGGAGAAIYVLWNLLSVSEDKDMKVFFLGSEKKKKVSPSGDERPSRAQIQLPNLA